MPAAPGLTMWLAGDGILDANIMKIILQQGNQPQGSIHTNDLTIICKLCMVFACGGNAWPYMLGSDSLQVL